MGRHPSKLTRTVRTCYAVPVSCVLYVPEAQGSLPLGGARKVRTAYRGITGTHQEGERGRAVESACAAIIELGAEDDFATMIGPG